jgi:hypothetical protein
MKRTIRNSYYAYKLIDPRSDKPFYVGKGYSTRMYAHKTEALKDKSEWSNPHKCRKILNILKTGKVLKYEYTLCENELAAIALEIQWISLYGISNDGGILTNISKSGQVANPITKPIDVYDVSGEFIKTFNSAAEAARLLGIPDPGIIRRCMNAYDSLKKYKNYVFVYSGSPFNYKNEKIKVVKAANGNVELTFNGTSEAAKHFNRSLSCIRQSCKHGWKINNYQLSYSLEKIIPWTKHII